ncbi:MAG: NAD(P)/FAD-dependent oxidoreductase, partial [Deltaproteobacteria bacterium]|nr:NAD(P)/FAD-dependent oxidoreductase [Deltaproteobacteria bacterium]
MTRSIYHDIIIVGSDVAGLLAGSLLSRRKYRVLHVAQGHLGVSYRDHGMELIGAPQLLPPYGHAPVLDNLLKEIGIEDPVHVLGSQDCPPLQVITPEQRIDIFSDDSCLKSELARTFPEQKDATLELINRLRTVD